MREGGALVSQAASIPAASRERHPELDWIKAFSIVTVVLIHSLPSAFAEKPSAVDGWLHGMTRFAVPGFLFASGFLYAGGPGEHGWLATTGRRLRRLLVPYVCFSLVAFFFPMPAWGTGTNLLDTWLFGSTLGPYWGSLLDALLFGSALGPYYYVFVIFWLILATPFIAQVPRPLFFLLVVAGFALQWGFESFQLGTSSFFWSFRNPLHWAASFLLGWWVSLHRDAVRSTVLRFRAAWIVLAAVLWIVGATYLAIGPAGRGQALARWLEIYASLALLFVAFVGRQRVPKVVLWLSEASYSIYLSHLFFIDAVMRAIPRVPGVFDPLRIGAAWAAGVGGGALTLILGRWLLGVRRARTWLG